MEQSIKRKKQYTNSKFSKDFGHLVRVFLKNLFKTFFGRKHMIFSWPKRALFPNWPAHTTTSINLTTKLEIRTEKAERDDKNDCKNQVFAAKTILNYLGNGNKKFIRCSVLCTTREIINKLVDFPLHVTFVIKIYTATLQFITYFALKQSCRSFGQTHRCSSSLANSPISDSFSQKSLRSAEQT